VVLDVDIEDRVGIDAVLILLTGACDNAPVVGDMNFAG
jgi:hypothetical protein